MQRKSRNSGTVSARNFDLHGLCFDLDRDWLGWHGGKQTRIWPPTFYSNRLTHDNRMSYLQENENHHGEDSSEEERVENAKKCVHFLSLADRSIHQDSKRD